MGEGEAEGDLYAVVGRGDLEGLNMAEGEMTSVGAVVGSDDLDEQEETEGDREDE